MSSRDGTCSPLSTVPKSKIRKRDTWRPNASKGQDAGSKSPKPVRIGSGRLSASGQWNTKLDGNFQAQYAGDLQDAHVMTNRR